MNSGNGTVVGTGFGNVQATSGFGATPGKPLDFKIQPNTAARVADLTGPTATAPVAPSGTASFTVPVGSVFNGNSYALSLTATTPEPGSIALVGFGIGVLALASARRARLREPGRLSNR